MKTKIIIILTAIIFITACDDLDLNPLSEGSSETWFSNETEIQMSVNDLFKIHFWPVNADNWRKQVWDDDWMVREDLTPVTAGTITGEWFAVENYWKNSYTAISRANVILKNLDEKELDIPQVIIDRYVGNALFVRAAQYARLISFFGDVVYFTGILDLDEAFKLGRTSKDIVLQAIYDDYDAAAEKLPLSYGSSENKLATKGAALAMKARIALYNGDFAIARDAAKACIDLGVYELFPDFSLLHLAETRNPDELVFGIPRSTEFGSYLSTGWTRDYMTRNAGGWGAAIGPSWALLSAFLCTDGLPIDESPLYDPREPFENRDPRCAATIVEFNTPHLGYIYTPHPDSVEVLNVNTGEYVSNSDTRSVAGFASFNGLAWKKGIGEATAESRQMDNDRMIMRYADVLLMYAEAKIELNEIDQSVLDAINRVRARAYGVDLTNTADYPVVTTTNQSELRKILRMERRMEFAMEGGRYMDIIRWRIAEKVLNTGVYGLLPVELLREKIIEPGLWFFPLIPSIDEDGIPDLAPLYEQGFAVRLAQRNFDASKQYLWPLPTKEVIINENLVQNPGY